MPKGVITSPRSELDLKHREILKYAGQFLVILYISQIGTIPPHSSQKTAALYFVRDHSCFIDDLVTTLQYVPLKSMLTIYLGHGASVLISSCQIYSQNCNERRKHILVADFN